MLRPYQENGLELIRGELRAGKKRIILKLPTGGGKTVMFSHIAKTLSLKHQVTIIMQRRQLVFQTADKFKQYFGLETQIVMANAPLKQKESNIKICSIDTLSRRLELPDSPYYIIDECHDTTSPKYHNLLSRIQDRIWFGFTATPYRTGNKGLSLWETCVSPITARELIAQGDLVKPKIYAPKVIDTSGIKTRNGDFDQKSLAQKASESVIVGDIIQTWKKYAEGRPTILFAVNIEHSSIMAEAFRQAGIPAIHCDAGHNQQEREKAISDLQTGRIKILCNVNIFSTGVDIPEASCLSLCRPTQSLILYIQQVGRGLRPDKQKNDCIVLDHAGNVHRHGLPHDEYPPQLTDGKSGSGNSLSGIAVKTCEICFAVFEAAEIICPSCGHTNSKKEREIKTESGDLILLDEQTINLKRLEEIKKTLKHLIYLSRIYHWKQNAAWFKLHDQYGDIIFNFQKELGIPTWLKGMTSKIMNEKLK